MFVPLCEIVFRFSALFFFSFVVCHLVEFSRRLKRAAETLLSSAASVRQGLNCRHSVSGRRRRCCCDGFCGRESV